MYLAESRSSTSTKVERRRWRRVPANVVALGVVSLVTDISSEMVTAILPLYLVIGLGLNPLQFGLLDGLYAGATAVLRLVGGHVADRWRRLKAVAGIGYGLSAVSKLGLLAAGTSVAAIGGVLAVDRAGKGIRTAPRDALISLSSEPGGAGPLVRCPSGDGHGRRPARTARRGRGVCGPASATSTLSSSPASVSPGAACCCWSCSSKTIREWDRPSPCRCGACSNS